MLALLRICSAPYQWMMEPINVLSLQVISHPHFLLVTLVLCNAAATEVSYGHLSYVKSLYIALP